MGIRGLDRGQRAALLISECQDGIANAEVRNSSLADQVTARGIVPRIRSLADAFRAAGLPVVHCHVALPEPGSGRAWPVNCVLAAQLAKAGNLVAGSSLAASHRELPVEPGDIISLRHHGMAPFTGTDLDSVLRAHNIQTVVLAGVSTNIALPGAATEAVGLGYNVILAEDCTAGGTADTHQIQVTMHLPLLATVIQATEIKKYI